MKNNDYPLGWRNIVSGLTFYRVQKFVDDYGSSDLREVEASISEAQAVSSRIRRSGHGKKAKHRVLLDIDHDAVLVPSSTPGHNHLYIDVDMSKRQYFKMLKALSKAGVIEPGYYRASKDRGYTSLRMPWVKKTGS